MKKRLRNNLFQSMTKNIGLKLLAFALAAIIWFIVTNITDPTEIRTFRNISVEIINEDVLTNDGKVYEVLDKTDVVSTVKVEGKRNVLDKLTQDDIKITADLSEITFLNTVSLKISSLRNNNDLKFNMSTDTLKLSVEDVKRTQMVINSSVVGNPADGYIVGTVTPSQNVVRISGPESVVEQIDHVDAVTNIGNYAYTSDITTSVDLVLYDADGKEIKNNAIKLNISTINITVTILATKEVPIIFEANGEPANGYTVTSAPVGSINTIKIAGKKAVVDAVNSITISDANIDITDATKDFVTIINIKKQLPVGVILADSSFDGSVTVTVPIEKLITRKYDIPVSNIAVGHVPDGFVAELVDTKEVETYSMSFTGVSSDLANLKAKDIVCVIDMDEIAKANEIEEWEEGSYVGEVHFSISSDKYIPAEKYTMTVELTSEID